MSDQQSWTIRRLLEWTTEYLQEKGSTSARLDAEILLAQSRDCERIQLYTAADEVPDEQTRTQFRELVKRRAEGTPVAYLVGSREFYSLPFSVTPDVLIPRPETEFVVIGLLDLVKETGSARRPLTIADVGTGSGILAICAARNLSGSRVTAIDLSPAALQIARKNAATHKVDDRIDFVESDLFASVPRDISFDFIVSNPPYVTRSEFEELAPDVKDHEPAMALIGGETGTEVIKRLIQQSSSQLQPGGWLIFEISPMIEQRVLELLDSSEGWESTRVTKDLAQHARVVLTQRAENKSD